MPELFLAAFGVVLLLLLLQKLEHAEIKLLIKTLKWTFVGVMVLAGIYLTLVGRLLHVAAIIVLLTLLLKQDVHKWVKQKRPPLPLSPPMSKKEAAALLKVKLKATPDEIQKAFEAIQAKDSTHQDLLLRARDVLLKKTRK
jgi:predicted membrane protein